MNAFNIVVIVVGLLVISVKAAALGVDEYRRVQLLEERAAWAAEQKKLAHESTCRNYPFLKVCQGAK